MYHRLNRLYSSSLVWTWLWEIPRCKKMSSLLGIEIKLIYTISVEKKRSQEFFGKKLS